jgi:hypothetical protein
MSQRIRFAAYVAILTIVVGIYAWRSGQESDYLVYSESLDEVAVVVDGNPLTLRDMAFYVAYEENLVEEEARIYNPKDTSAYWKVRMGGSYVRTHAKQAAIDMAVHDEIFYQLAVEDELELTEEEMVALTNSQYDFWNDLTEEQQAALGVTREEMDVSLEKAALAEKYEFLWTGINGEEEGAYAIGGTAYEDLLELHEVEVNRDVWKMVFFGEVTTTHT